MPKSNASKSPALAAAESALDERLAEVFLTRDQIPITEHTVERDGDVPLIFNGILLGVGHSAVPCLDKLRNTWTERGHEAKIYETASGKYVLGFIAWSRVESETDRYKAIIAETPRELYDGMKALTAKGIPDSALFALQKAAEADPRLKEIAAERI